ncbi:phospho-acceptor domain-containing protein [Paenibacillus pabuli]|uniref:histidine kinase n=2 Tax=Paenibacillus TaxID=44249 RepID=A0A855YAJ9_9BACL|nr:phospho-acceptor domain-containing protein [Paenibacillus pabuli]PXW09352.1 phospho-acceptor domain-containing protein [Paenibacillus taichungensis]
MTVIRTDRFLLGVGLMTMLLALVVVLQIGGGRETPVAKKGTLELADFSWTSHTIIPLDGEWEFYPEQLLSPQQIHLTHIKPIMMQVPGNWDEAVINQGYPMSGKGYGTYRLIVRNVPQGEQLAIAKRYVRFADAMYLDGQLMSRSGLPGTSAGSYKPRNEPYTIYFHTEQAELEIVLQVANFDFRSGGIYNSIELGYASQIEKRTMIQSGLELFIMGIVVIFGLLFFYLYLRLHRDRIQLLYALFFLGFAVIVVTNGERLLLQLAPGIPFEFAFKMKYAAVYGVSVVVSMITWKLAPGLGQTIRRWLQLPSVLLALYVVLILISPFRVYSSIQEGMYSVNLLSYAVAFAVILHHYVMKKYESKSRAQLQLLITCIWLMLVNYVLGILVTWYPVSQILLNCTTLVILSVFAVLLIYQYVRAYDAMQQLTQQLQLSDKVKDEFLLLTSHELNSPLHSIIHLSRSLLGTSLRRTNETEIRSKLQLIRNTSYRMSNLVNDLIDMSRFRDGNMKIAVGTVDLVSCLSLVTEVLGFLATGKGIVMVRRLEPEARYVMADESRLLQVLYNLVYHMIGQHSHRELVFECEWHQERVRIMLRFEAHTEQITRLGTERPDLESMHNSSAGLSVAAELVSMMGGQLSVNDAAESIQIELPSAEVAGMENVIETAVSQEKLGEDLSGLPSGNASAAILIATTDLVDMEHLNTLLSTEGFQVSFADSDMEVQSLLASGKLPDLVIVDAMLPAVTGYEVCKQIRLEFSQVDLPVLFINMRSTPADIEACIKAGGNDFITRPLDAGEILVRVHTLLGMKRLVKEAANNEMAFLRSQIKPHFLYNALGTIMSLCFTDGPRAGELLGSFSRYLRILFHLDNSEELIPLSKEMELIQAYVEIEQERFGSRLQVELDVDRSLYSCKVMPLLIEPLVENAIRHGVSKKIDGGTVRLYIQKYENRVQVVVEDDGVGMSPEQAASILDRSHIEQGIGLQNVQRRLKHLNGQAPVIQSEQGHGTKITFEFPYQ